MKVSFKPIVAALLFAILLISSSYFLKENPVGDWIDAGVYMAGVYFALRYFTKSPKVCSTKQHNPI